VNRRLRGVLIALGLIGTGACSGTPGEGQGLGGAAYSNPPLVSGGRLCRPCAADADCQTASQPDALCLSSGSAGSYCGVDCTQRECPAGFSCHGSKGSNGTFTAQCVKDAGACVCDRDAVDAEAETVCSIGNAHGQCLGQRTCGPSGLSECNARTPSADVCNGVDDDCDGHTDPGYLDTDNDGLANCVDPDPDGDGIDSDGDGSGVPGDTPCGYGLAHCDDNCPLLANPAQLDDDDDGIGNPCDDDRDGDGRANALDCKPTDPTTFAGAEEVCDGADNDCDGETDEDLCDDANGCTFDQCIPGTGCVHPSLVMGCDDGDPCTHGDQCTSGACTPGPAVDCDDDNECTGDACAPGSGCVFAPLETSCSDGDPCTTLSQCANGTCPPGQPVDCNDHNPCTTDSCGGFAGCIHTTGPLPCDDGNACTGPDKCSDGACVGPAVSCGEIGACALALCDPAIGCSTKFLPGLICDDGDACSTEDHCDLDGVCLGLPGVACDDGNPCTLDECSPAVGCTHTLAALPCEDDDLCTTDDVCANGACVAGSTVDCTDGDPCTDDDCGPWLGCLHAAAMPCLDDEPCHATDCVAMIGCVTTMSDGPCDDDDVCTGDDTCLDGTCLGAPVSCDDGSACTLDLCTGAGCSSIALPGIACSDGDPCTQGDTCHSTGQCAPGAPKSCSDGTVCSADWCDSQSGCKHTPTFALCSDGDGCTANDVCNIALQCVGQPVVCNDGNQCTVDHCDHPAGCAFLPATGLGCDDGDACTSNDLCAADGQCIGSPKDCDDGDICTTEICVLGGCLSLLLPVCGGP
jgi:hypothetical protein